MVKSPLPDRLEVCVSLRVKPYDIDVTHPMGKRAACCDSQSRVIIVQSPMWGARFRREQVGMKDQDKTKEQLISELEELRRRVSALEASETEWRRTEEALQGSEERFRLLVEAIPQPIWRSDADGNVIEFNRRWHEYTGQTAEEAKGNGWTKAVHPDEAAMVVGKVRAGITSGAAIEIVNRLRRASDGSYRWHLARAVPMNDRGGKIIGWFGCATDIDDQKQAEEALAEREARLLEAQEVAKSGLLRS